MSILKYLLLLFTVLIIASCEISEPQIEASESVNVVTPRQLNSETYEAVYHKVMNDANYKEMLISASSIYKTLDVKLPTGSETELLDAINHFDSNDIIIDLTEYWNHELQKSENKSATILALSNSTNHLINSLGLGDDDEPVEDECEYDYGAFGGLDIIHDCDFLGELRGCCAEAICNAHNCENEIIKDINEANGVIIDIHELSPYTALIGTIRAGAKGGFFAIGGIIAAKALFGGVSYTSAIIRLTGCAFTYLRSCEDCNCPTAPLCDYDSGGEYPSEQLRIEVLG